jgi:pyruvate,orthophosphate dikinase
MVFGNMGTAPPPASASPGTPPPAKKEFYGEFLQNAQGEDVVAGIRTPHPSPSSRR